jgi:CyaY protein
MPDPNSPASLGDAEYHRLASATLARVEAQLDAWLEDDVIDIDAQRTGGLLELTLPSGGKIVINTQPPLHEIWLAARAGGYHFRFVRGGWQDTKDGLDFFERLSREVSAQAGTELTFSS